jgi:hypothetical protein
MTSPDRLDALTFTGCFAELESDIPPGLTLTAWRCGRTGSKRDRPGLADASTGRGAAGAGLAPQDRTLRVLGRAHRPRSGRGPSPRRYK